MTTTLAKTCVRCGTTHEKRGCPECARIRAAAHYEANKARARANTARYREKNREQYLASLRKWRDAHPERNRATVCAKYGLTLEDYVRIAAEQDGRCAICRRTPKPGKNLTIDHDHETGAVRALLCVRCNTIVGYHEHALAAEARAYIKKHGGSHHGG